MSPSHDPLAREFGEVVSDLVFAPAGELAELLRVHLADGRVLTFGARDLASAAAIADGIVRPLLASIAHRGLRAGLPQPEPLAVDELQGATVRYFVERCRAITRENVRSILRDRIPDDQGIVKVERVHEGGTHA
jgi:hypothetical protein